MHSDRCLAASIAVSSTEQQLAAGRTAAVTRPVRHDWMDYAKGICIVAVVSFYTTNHVSEALERTTWMQYWIEFARPFRMPDFFFISGLLLGRVIERPWRTYADAKVVHYLYFFVIWSLLYFIFRLVIGSAGETPTRVGAEFVKVMTHGPFAMLWFVQMLAFYFVLTKLLRRVPAWLVFTLAVAWYLAPIDTAWSQVDRAGERYVFFFAGYWIAPMVFGYARWVAAHRGVALTGILAWVAVDATLVFSGAANLRAVSLLLGFLGAFAVIGVAALLQSVRALDVLRRCGQDSLPIYVGFFLPMWAIVNLYEWSTDHFGRAPLEPGVAAVLFAVFSIAIALAAERAARGTRLAWLYERPRRARLGPSAPGQA
ncbi:MAG: acyltransferase family protein [Burkholderiaceae bacterium]|nr:acyltransferase family protein [Burkholderiaceae bacterium]